MLCNSTFVFGVTLRILMDAPYYFTYDFFPTRTFMWFLFSYENVKIVWKENNKNQMVLDKVLYDLESENYTTQTFIIPATGVGANHQRKRLWIVAHSNIPNTKSFRYRGSKSKECNMN